MNIRFHNAVMSTVAPFFCAIGVIIQLFKTNQ